MAEKHHLTVEQVTWALHEHGGKVALAARALGCSQSTIYRMMSNNPVIDRLRKEAQEYMLDIAEQRLTEAVEKGSPWAIKFTLERLGSERGYVETKELRLVGPKGYVTISPDDWDELQAPQTPMLTDSGTEENGTT